MSDTHNTRNYAAHGGGEWVIGGKLTVLEGATVAGLGDVALLVPAVADTLGCVKAAPATAADTLEAKIAEDNKLYVTPYALPAAGAALGGVKAAEAGAGDTLEVKLGADQKLYITPYALSGAGAEALGGVKLAENQVDSTASTISALNIEFNALLAKLKAAGIMAPDAEA